MSHVYSCSRSWDIIVLLSTYYHTFYSPFFLSLTILNRLEYKGQKRLLMLSTFLFYLLLLTQKEKNEKRNGKTFYKKCSHNGSYSMNIHRLFNLVYRLFSRTFLFVSTISFYLKLPKLAFKRRGARDQLPFNFCFRNIACCS